MTDAERLRKAMRASEYPLTTKQVNAICAAIVEEFGLTEERHVHGVNACTAHAAFADDVEAADAGSEVEAFLDAILDVAEGVQ
jgi:hypothetical protein